jgi:hypothetical protein
MPSINVDLDYFDHPKVRRLSGQLGLGAAELPLRLWCYTGKYFYVDGRLTGLSADDLEQQISWRGQKGKAISALLECGFLELDDSGTYVSHDFMDWQGHILAYKTRAKVAVKAREKKRARDRGGTDDEKSSSVHLVDDNKIILRPSNALPCIESSFEEGESKGEGTFSDAAPSVAKFENSPAGLAQEFVFYQTGGKESEFLIREKIEGLVADCWSLNCIGNLIRARKNKAERFFQIEKRLEKSKKSDKSPLSPEEKAKEWKLQQLRQKRHLEPDEDERARLQREIDQLAAE